MKVIRILILALLVSFALSNIAAPPAEARNTKRDCFVILSEVSDYVPNSALAVRFENQLANLYSVIKPHQRRAAGVVVDDLIEADARQILHRLDSLIRLYRDAEEIDDETEEAFAAAKKKINALSRHLGAARDTNKMYKYAKKNDLPREVVSYLKGRHHEAFVELAEFLEEKDWLEGRPQLLENIVEAIIGSEDVEENSDEEQVVLGLWYLVGQLNAWKTLLPRSKTNYVPDDFENGPHIYRKQLRRLLYSLDIVSDRLPAKLSLSAANKKKIEAWISELADAKDIIQRDAQLTEAYMEVYDWTERKSRTEVRAILSQKPNYQDPYVTAKKVLDEIKKSRILIDYEQVLKRRSEQ